MLYGDIGGPQELDAMTRGFRLERGGCMSDRTDQVQSSEVDLQERIAVLERKVAALFDHAKSSPAPGGMAAVDRLQRQFDDIERRA